MVSDSRSGAHVDGADHIFFSYLNKGEFRIPRCAECDRSHFSPRLICPFCGSDALTWKLAEGRGAVYATTVVRKRSSAHNVALVDLCEGPRMMTRVEGIAPEDVRIGMVVLARIAVGEGPLVVFTPEAVS